ncbi:hypothetical protein ACWGJ2_19385 [Streptomyces sp. NPDC054796]
MVSLIFALLAAAQLGLAVAAVRYWRRAPGWLTVVPALVSAALVWDNGVIALGDPLGAGPLLETLSVPRFVLHALLTPLLVLWALAAADHAGVSGARRGPVRAVATALTALLIAAGVHHDILGLTLRAERWGGALRYVNDSTSPVGPLPAVLTGLIVLAAGIVLWRRTGFGRLALTSAVMVVASGAAARVPPLGNAAEVVLITGVLLTVRAFLPRPGARDRVAGDGSALAP